MSIYVLISYIVQHKIGQDVLIFYIVQCRTGRHSLISYIYGSAYIRLT